MFVGIKYIVKGLILLACCGYQQTFAQQEYQFSQIHQFPLVLNPAYTGFEPDVNLNLIYRSQWIGLQGAPQSYVLTADLPIDYFNSGFGVLLSNDEIGVSRLTKASLLYSYKYRINQSAILSAGINIGAFQYQFDGTQLLTTDGLYENVINHNDELLTNELSRSIQPDVGIGLYFASPWLEAGVAANSIVNIKLNEGNSAESATYQSKPQYNIQLKTNFEVLDNITIKPALFVHSDLKIHQLNIALPVEVGRAHVGLGYRGYSKRSNDAVIFMLGFEVLENFVVHYAYDLNVSSLKQAHSGSHEFVLKYRFKNLIPSPKSKIIYNPRFL